MNYNKYWNKRALKMEEKFCIFRTWKINLRYNHPANYPNSWIMKINLDLRKMEEENQEAVKRMS